MCPMCSSSIEERKHIFVNLYLMAHCEVNCLFDIAGYLWIEVGDFQMINLAVVHFPLSKQPTPSDVNVHLLQCTYLVKHTKCEGFYWQNRHPFMYGTKQTILYTMRQHSVGLVSLKLIKNTTDFHQSSFMSRILKCFLKSTILRCINEWNTFQNFYY